MGKGDGVKKKESKTSSAKLPAKEIRRQSFHLLAGVVLVFLLNANILQIYHLGLILLLGFVISLVSRKYSLPGISWFLHHFDREGKLPGYGVLTLLLGSTLALALFSKNIALASIMILALGDSLSHLGRFGSIRHPFNKTKFLEGTAIGIIAGTLGALYFVSLSAAFLGSLAAMIAESFDLHISKVKIDDNLLIPLVGGLVMSLVGV